MNHHCVNVTKQGYQALTTTWKQSILARYEDSPHVVILKLAPSRGRSLREALFYSAYAAYQYGSVRL